MTCYDDAIYWADRARTLLDEAFADWPIKPPEYESIGRKPAFVRDLAEKKIRPSQFMYVLLIACLMFYTKAA